jgi:hypothetical protein
MGGLLELAWPIPNVFAIHCPQSLCTLNMICKTDKSVVPFRLTLLIVLDYSAFCEAWEMVKGLG